MSYFRSIFERSTLDNVQQKRIIYISVFLLLIFFLRSFHFSLRSSNFTWWLFNYQDEFIKRGLLGELLRLSVVDVTYGIVWSLSLIIIITLLVVLVYVFTRPFKQALHQTGAWLFFGVMITHSATFQNFNNDSGRFDGLLLLLSLFSIFIIEKTPRIIAYIGVILIFCVAILIHEAFFIMYVPLVMAYWIYREPTIKSAPFKVLLFMGLLFMGLLLFTFMIIEKGVVSNQSFEEHLTKLEETYGDLVYHQSLRVIYRDSTDTFIFTLKYVYATLISGRYLNEHFKMIIILFPFGLLVYRIIFPFLNLKDRDNRFRLLLLLSAFGPLLLYPIAIDHYRWWALAITNLCIALSLLATHDEIFRDHISNVLFKNRKLAFLVIFLSFIAGPLGVWSVFPTFLF